MCMTYHCPYNSGTACKPAPLSGNGVARSWLVRRKTVAQRDRKRGTIVLLSAAEGRYLYKD